MIPDSDLEITLERDPLYNYGGQHVGSPNCPIKVVHIPTGITAIVQLDRSQHKKKQIAIDMILTALTHKDFRWLGIIEFRKKLGQKNLSKMKSSME